MNKLDDIKPTLKKMIFLLRAENFEDWVETLEAINLDSNQSLKSISKDILSIYGGAGSVNDIVFYKEGQSLTDKNNEFDELRTHLYELCKMFINEGIQYKTP